MMQVGLTKGKSSPTNLIRPSRSTIEERRRVDRAVSRATRKRRAKRKRQHGAARTKVKLNVAARRHHAHLISKAYHQQPRNAERNGNARTR